MLLADVKKKFYTKIKIAGGLTPPSDVELEELIQEALTFIATACTPRELLRDSIVDTDDLGEVLRNLAGGLFIMKPETPIFDKENTNYSALAHLKMDNDLDYAVINTAAALYSRDAKDILKFENEALKIINQFKANFNKVKE